MLIRAYAAADWPGVWAILEPVFRAGETYAFPRDMSESQAHDTWTAAGKHVFVAVDEATGELLGTYYVKANFEGAASHICNCGYVVSERARGRGIAARMCEHSQREMRLARGLRDGVLDLIRLYSRDGRLTIDDHLWCVHILVAEDRRVAPLTRRE